MYDYNGTFTSRLGSKTLWEMFTNQDRWQYRSCQIPKGALKSWEENEYTGLLLDRNPRVPSMLFPEMWNRKYRKFMIDYSFRSQALFLTASVLWLWEEKVTYEPPTVTTHATLILTCLSPLMTEVGQMQATCHSAKWHKMKMRLALFIHSILLCAVLRCALVTTELLVVTLVPCPFLCRLLRRAVAWRKRTGRRHKQGHHCLSCLVVQFFCFMLLLSPVIMTYQLATTATLLTSL